MKSVNLLPNWYLQQRRHRHHLRLHVGFMLLLGAAVVAAAFAGQARRRGWGVNAMSLLRASPRWPTRKPVSAASKPIFAASKTCSWPIARWAKPFRCLR